MSAPEPSKISAAEQIAATELAVQARRHRRTALIVLKGELDVASVTQVTDVLDGLQPRPDVLRHIVLDLRGLTFMDSTGVRGLLEAAERDRPRLRIIAPVSGDVRVTIEETGIASLLPLVEPDGEGDEPPRP